MIKQYLIPKLEILLKINMNVIFSFRIQLIRYYHTTNDSSYNEELLELHIQ